VRLLVAHEPPLTYLLDEPGTAFFSIHQFPCYPGTGAADVGDNCFNYPVAPETPPGQYRQMLSKALEDLKRFKPDLVAVSAGFDAYHKDPLTEMTLEQHHFASFGRWLKETGLPGAPILEGGYSNDLPILVEAFLEAWSD